MTRPWLMLSVRLAGLVLLAGAACSSRSGQPVEGGVAGSGGTAGDGGLTKGDAGPKDSGATDSESPDAGPTDSGSTADSGVAGSGGSGGGPMGDAGPGGNGGSLGGGGAGGGPIPNCQADVSARVPPAPLRRLSSFAYANTVRDVLGLSLATNPFPPAGDVSDDVGTLTALTDAYHRIAHDFARAAGAGNASLDAFGKCDVAASGETTCAQRFVAAFVPRLFRRPLEPDDASAFADVFAKGRELGGDYASGIRAVIEVAMQSPEFLYRVEFGQAVDPKRPALGRPGPHEMATRLSYLFLASAPDEALTAAAAADELKTSEQIEKQARRLLADTRARDVTRDFYSRLFRIGAFAGGSGGVPNAAALEETTRFLDDVVWVEGGDLATLLGAPFSFVNLALAQTYGIAGVSGTAFQRVTLPAAQRRGILTQVSLLAPRSATDARLTHPSERGALIFEQLLCGDLSQTPPGEQHLAPAQLGGETMRQYLERVTAPTACRSCHGTIDGLGLPFEHYSSSGAWRDADSGAVIDARGILTGVDTGGGVDGALDLVDRLVRSRVVRACHVGKWMETAYGRAPVAADACSRGQLEQAFEGTGGNIRELMIGLTQTEAFLYRPAP